MEHYTIWYREPGGNWIPSTTWTRKVDAIIEADKVQKAMPFASVQVLLANTEPPQF